MAPATRKELEDKMQIVSMELQKIELELQKCVEVRQRLDSQLNENDQVKKVSQREILASLSKAQIDSMIHSLHPLYRNLLYSKLTM